MFGGVARARVVDRVQPLSEAPLQVFVIIESVSKEEAIFDVANEAFYASLLLPERGAQRLAMTLCSITSWPR